MSDKIMSEISGLTKTLNEVNRTLNVVAVDVAVLKEKSTHAVEETTVFRIVKEALNEHLSSCTGNKNGGIFPYVNPRVIQSIVYVLLAAAGALAGKSFF